VARTCFQPPPNVDSALVAFRRRQHWGPEYAALKETVQAAFAHRRKTLGNSLDLSGIERARVGRALAAMNSSEDIRAERLTPDEFVRLAELLL
jgi:16S rRNA (adenine1518-N6/adenine1519-N6)-dimethyltransferase